MLLSSRYEVIYKNFLRDLRKFYLRSFNDETDYQSAKNKQAQHCLMTCLKAYASNLFPETPDELLERIVFVIGSVIYPQELLAEHQKQL
jgi:hypothetical protein